MAGPTTEVLNDDIKDLKRDLRDVRGDMESIKTDLKLTTENLAELTGEVRVIIKIAGLAGALIIATVLTGGFASVWWAGATSQHLSDLDRRFDKMNAKVEKLEAKIDARFEKIDARLDRFEASILKALDKNQGPTRPAP